MNEKNQRITTAVAILILVSTVGGFIYSNQKANAKDAKEKQELIASIDKQHDLEDQAKALKADALVVAISPHKQEIADTPSTASIPQQATQKVGPAITTLTDADILRLQSYKQYDGGGSYVSFKDMYSGDRASCDALAAKFSSITLNDYAQAKTEWLTSSKLVYRSLLSQYCVRGILTLTYYSEGNKFGLKPNVKYQREVEYRLRNSITQGQITLKLESINYLTGFKEVA